MRKDFADVDFPVDRLITQAEQVKEVGDALRDVDGILVIHLSMGITPVLPKSSTAGGRRKSSRHPIRSRMDLFRRTAEGEDGASLECT